MGRLARVLCRADIDDQLKNVRLDNRHGGWAITLENHRCVDPDLAIWVRQAWAVAHETAGLGTFAPGIGRGDIVFLASPTMKSRLLVKNGSASTRSAKPPF